MTMNVNDVVTALERVKVSFEETLVIMQKRYPKCLITSTGEITKGGYFRVGNVAIKIAEIEELK